MFFSVSKWIFVIAVCISLINSSLSLRCYKCSGYHTNEYELEKCINDPESFAQDVGCSGDRPVCLTVRQFERDRGTVRTFYRTCGFKDIEQCTDDAAFNTCYSVCTSDLCNVGDGRVTEYRVVKVDKNSSARVGVSAWVVVAAASLAMLLRW